VHIIVDGAFYADDLACFFTAVQTGWRTIITLAAFLAPPGRFKITLITVGAMMTMIDGTFLANHRANHTGASLVKFHAIGAQHTLLAPALHIKITLFATGAVGFIASGTVFAKLGSMDFGALLVIACTVATQTALSAKMFHTAIACITAGAMGVLIRGTLKAKAHPVVATARSVYFFYTIIAPTTFLTPFAHDKIASFTIGAVGALIKNALQTHLIADLLVGAAVTNFRAGTIGALAALNAQIYTRITLVAFLAIGRAVNQIFTIGTAMRCKDG